MVLLEFFAFFFVSNISLSYTHKNKHFRVTHLFTSTCVFNVMGILILVIVEDEFKIHLLVYYKEHHIDNF